jgi:hypothetical protein
MENYSYDSNKITYQQIIFRQIQKIQDIVAKELRDTDKTIKNLIGEQIIESEDTRYSYLQSVEMLGSLLSPYFPEIKKDTKNVNSNFNEFCELYDMELKTALKDEDFKKEVSELFSVEIKDIDNKIKSKDKEFQNSVNVYFLNYKIIIARRIFRELIKLFKENDFLGNESFGETSGSDEGLDAVDEKDGDFEV